MNRIEEKLKQIKEKKQKAFITYTTAGLPDLEGTKKTDQGTGGGRC